MGLFSVLLITASVVWIAFEIWLVVRDRFIGKGTTGKDSGTRYFNFIALTVGFSVASIIRNNPIFFRLLYKIHKSFKKNVNQVVLTTNITFLFVYHGKNFVTHIYCPKLWIIIENP